ncbi:hypothetical protein GCM10028806_18420 [Spirosoma terrae]|uniref:Uncharacterized protein n=1 Tax=Spirosoma terrae TaxID=1968276 RepID=A0A6L9LI02_9BACT|nr:hypothetical protein [Spirosoma terrae]NDU96259.1 hypothetical protein [Spirosoma terrae]
MEKDKGYYEQFLRDKEKELLDSVGDLLQIEMVLFDLRKLYLKALDLEEEGEKVAQQLRDQEKRLRQLLSVEKDRLADLELDIAHAKFMIDLFNQKP